MAQQTLNDGVSFGEQRSKINSNFTELYSTKTANSNAAITGGIINGTSIGQTTPATGAFTTLSATGDASLIGNEKYQYFFSDYSIGSNARARVRAVGGGGGSGYGGSFQIDARNSSNVWGTVADFSSSGLSVAGSGTFGGNVSATGRLSTAGIKEDASGNLLVGTTDQNLLAEGFALVKAANAYLGIGHASPAVSGDYYQVFRYNNVSIGSITQNGTTSVAYNTTSDHRLKENIRPANAGRFNDIKFVDFEWIDGRHDCGVIAHQLQEIYPDLVIGEKDVTEIRKVEITPAVPAVTEQQLVSEALFNEDGEEIEPAVYETIEITPAVEAVFEDQEFPVYQQVNYIGLIGRMGTRIQMLDKLATEQAEVISKLEARLSALEDKLN